MKAGIVVNPQAGRGRAERLAGQAERELRESGARCELLRTNAMGAATTLARNLVDAGCQLVFAAGGDGTINEVVQGLVGRDVILGVVPAGLANVWAAEAGISSAPGAFAALVRDGRVFQTDLGVLRNGAGVRHFLAMAGIGLDAAVVADVSANGKARWGQLAYAAAAANQVVRWRAPNAEVSVDGRPLAVERLAGVIAANTSRYAGLFELSASSLLDDGLLEMLVYGEGGTLSRMRSALLVDHRVRRWDRRVTSLQGRQLTVAAASPLPVHTDAELAGQTPCRVEVAPRALRVLLPATAARRFCSPGKPLSLG
ncbi:MAG: diacylglycerol kinase family lipid kinase [Chloroflexi bacterium]|nr:diacylglycerol kinase family lipid kinase [Chloroflexota bacterium]